MEIAPAINKILSKLRIGYSLSRTAYQKTSEDLIWEKLIDQGQFHDIKFDFQNRDVSFKIKGQPDYTLHLNSTGPYVRQIEHDPAEDHYALYCEDYDIAGSDHKVRSGMFYNINALSQETLRKLYAKLYKMDRGPGLVNTNGIIALRDFFKENFYRNVRKVAAL
ncbi:MAG: hypothetical protein FWG18_01825 [Alphaproteobacteria bacterium]|nr:hypothetical protein [Alphaproteobacteria bacterium]